MESYSGMALTRKNEELREKPVPVPVYPPEIPQELTQASTVRGQRLTA
jgi:hypothetical protein